MSSHLAARTVQHVDALAPGERLGEFEVLSLLGVGGFGMVYRAYDHSLRRFVAIKEYMPAALAGRAHGQSVGVRSASDEPAYQAGLGSFVNEARLLAQFDHPSLVKVFRFWEANRTAYMVMPLYAGMTLKQARSRMRQPPPEAWLRQVLWSVLGALRLLHGAQMLHRDISPDNIFLQHLGPPVLLDLGAARQAIGERDRQHTAVLKVNYAPIEQYAEVGSDLRQGAWSDLYSLAAVVHGCLCNETPMPATLRAIRDRMVPFERVAQTMQQQWGLEYSPSFVQGISRALQLQPQDRPQSVDELVQLLELQPPATGLERFDFQAELGATWAEDGGPSAPAASALADVPTVETPRAGATSPGRPPAAAAAPQGAPDLDLSAPVALVSAEPVQQAPARSGLRPPVLALLAGALVTAALAFMSFWRAGPESQPARTPDSEIITESSRTDGEGGAAAGSAVPAAVAATAAPAGSSGARAAAATQPARAQKPAETPRPAARRGHERGPEEACADASVLTRPMCVHNECQKPALAKHPVCVQLRRKAADEARRRETYSP